MLTTEPLFAKRTPAVQFLVLLLLVVSSAMFTFFVGILVAMPFFGTDVLNSLAAAGDLTIDKDIAMMKYFQVVSQLGVFIVPSLLFSFLVSRNILSYLRIDQQPASISILLTILLVFSIMPAIHWLVEQNEGLHLPDFLSRIEEWMKSNEEDALKITEAFLSTTSISGVMANILMIGLLAAVGEELLFRSLFIRLFEGLLKNVHIAVVVSALLFSAFHFQFFGFLPRFALGLLFGYLFVWSGSVWLPILAHFANNASAVLIYYFINTGRIQSDAEQFGANDNMLRLIVSVLVSIAFLALIFFAARKRHSHQ